ncbi:hypothetical protein GCM10022224_103610 [Nonomuraea antimicrobica]|uniref:DNA binding domain-containing protein, excisionase family n=1 Tax=Nonomuraea antimicrobica TaxID=561173 RepID=A0ABP7EMC4_9ACTN
MATTSRRRRSLLPNPEIEPTISVPRAGELLELGRAASYEAAKRGDIPTIRIGRKLAVPTAKLLALLGLS